MYLVLTNELAAQRIADLHREAEIARLARAPHIGGGRARRRRAAWVRWAFRQASRQAGPARA